MRSTKEMTDLIIGVALGDERIEGVIMTGSRADTRAAEDIYQDYDIIYFVQDVAPFYNNLQWIEECFGMPTVMQMPEIMSRPAPCEEAEKFVYLMIFGDGNRIDLTVTSKGYGDEGEPAIILLDKVGQLDIQPREDFWDIKRPCEKEFQDCCNEFWWCLNNVAKGIMRDELPYAMEMFNVYVRDMLNKVVEWYIGVDRGFSVSSGKMGKYFKRYLPLEMYQAYEKTYSDSSYESLWESVFAACKLFHGSAEAVGESLSFTYNLKEEQGMLEYIYKVKDGRL